MHTVYYAHRLEDKPREEWQRLDEHLKNVAALARKFAKPFGAGNWAYAAGLLHDIGKFSDKFQEYLTLPAEKQKKLRGKINHSSAGAQEVIKLIIDQAGKPNENIAKIIAYAIAGHHAGLANGKDNTRADLETRLYVREIDDYSQWQHVITPPQLSKSDIEELTKSLQREEHYQTAFAISFFIRMLFSCVVDADRFD
ncbi:CRISPR-associated endonuclease Cas3'', partial [candidate division WOR-3 bacterium]|nr:CRISPR-associated endonuclease Cas3'' [candidate division WOR-3 bacterium]